VYAAVFRHPLGLVPGDIVLGYDRIPWKRLYKDLIAAQLPLTSFWWWGSSESSFNHSMLMSAGMNWHLFDTIDVVKYASGDTLHLSTTPLRGVAMSLFCTEQLDIPGVPKPNYYAQHLVSHGIIPGTNIGYIYGLGWSWNAQQEFLDAVQALMQTDGLIIDFRTNYGGNMFLSNPGLSLLFANPTPTIDFAGRSDPSIHEAMSPKGNSSTYIIPGSPPAYMKPIAVLTGPGAVSSGDQVALRMTFHPRARVFGKSTSTAFNAPSQVDLENHDWYFAYARADAFLLSNPNAYLTHREFPVDRSIWHTPSAVAHGRDNVVDAARTWIDSSLSSVTVAQDFRLEQNYPNPFNRRTGIQFSLPHSEFVILKVFNILGAEIATLVSNRFSAGTHEVEWNAYGFPSGVYFYRFQAGTFAQTKASVLLK
jgi:hypothetical protein